MSTKKIVNPCDDVEAADAILEEWHQICKDLNITTYLCYGTCLGFVRNGNYINGDNDIDVAILEDIDYQQVYDKLREHDFHPKVYTCKNPYLKNKHWVKNNIKLDLNYMVPKQFLVLCMMEYKGHWYCMPYPVERYLEYMYGEDWRTPKHQEKRHLLRKGLFT